MWGKYHVLNIEIIYLKQIFNCYLGTFLKKSSVLFIWPVRPVLWGFYRLWDVVLRQRLGQSNADFHKKSFKLRVKTLFLSEARTC